VSAATVGADSPFSSSSVTRISLSSVTTNASLSPDTLRFKFTRRRPPSLSGRVDAPPHRRSVPHAPPPAAPSRAAARLDCKRMPHWRQWRCKLALCCSPRPQRLRVRDPPGCACDSDDGFRRHTDAANPLARWQRDTRARRAQGPQSHGHGLTRKECLGRGESSVGQGPRDCWRKGEVDDGPRSDRKAGNVRSSGCV
jgi:hypothetical protein